MLKIRVSPTLFSVNIMQYPHIREGKQNKTTICYHSIKQFQSFKISFRIQFITNKWFSITFNYYIIYILIIFLYKYQSHSFTQLHDLLNLV